MANYKISGVWKNSNNEITHYAFHEIVTSGITRARKVTKAEAIRLLESGNKAITWIWNYTQAKFIDGELVEVVNRSSGKYLRSNPDNTTTDNLLHLINFDWINAI